MPGEPEFPGALTPLKRTLTLDFLNPAFVHFFRKFFFLRNACNVFFVSIFDDVIPGLILPFLAKSTQPVASLCFFRQVALESPCEKFAHTSVSGNLNQRLTVSGKTWVSCSETCIGGFCEGFCWEGEKKSPKSWKARAHKTNGVGIYLRLILRPM